MGGLLFVKGVTKGWAFISNNLICGRKNNGAGIVGEG